MASKVVTPSLPYSIADSFAEAIKNEVYNYYYFIGATPTLSSGESESSESYKRKIRDNIIFMKKVSPSDVSLITSLHKWASGLVYEQWDDYADMLDKKFFCVNTNNEVFKCLDNGNNKESSIMPDKPISDWHIPFQTSDDYTWQYLYTVDPFEKNKFMTSRYLPVRSALSKYFYSGNSVSSVKVNESGSGYLISQKTKLDIIDKHRSAHVNSVSTIDGEILSFNQSEINLIKNIKYDTELTVRINTNTGVGAIIEIIPDTNTGYISDLRITNPGRNYRKGDSITIIKPAIIMASLDDNGSFHEVKIIDAGGGYTEIPEIVISYTDEFATLGRGKYYVNGQRNPSALFEAVIDSNSESENYGKLIDVIIKDPGINYDHSRATIIKVLGDGYGADFIPLVINGMVKDVSVINPGRNYTWMELKVIGGNTTNEAKLTPIFIKSDIYSNQSILEQLINQPSTQGGIYSIKVLNEGEGYNSSTCEIKLSGDGIGATAIPVIESGAIKRIKMTSFGSGYTYCEISITDTERDNNIAQPNASLRAIIPPVLGHGSNSADELLTNELYIHTTIQDIDQIDYLINDYTQFGFIRGVKSIGSNDLSSVVSDFTLFKTTFSSINGLNLNDVLTLTLSGRTVRFKVVKIETPRNVYLIQMSSIYRSIGTKGTFYKEQTAYNWTASTTDLKPVLNKYSGELLYSGNIDSFTIDDQKRVSIKTKITI